MMFTEMPENNFFDLYLATRISESLRQGDRQKMNICCFCAGPGGGQKQRPVLPIRTLELLKEFAPVLDRSRLRVEVLFNEYNKADFQLLRQRVATATAVPPFQDRSVAVFVRNEEALSSVRRNAWIMRPDRNLFLFGELAFHKRFHNLLKQLEEFEATDVAFFISAAYAKQFAGKRKFSHPGETPQDACMRGHGEIFRQFLAIYPETCRSRIFYRYFPADEGADSFILATRQAPAEELGLMRLQPAEVPGLVEELSEMASALPLVEPSHHLLGSS